MASETVHYCGPTFVDPNANITSDFPFPFNVSGNISFPPFENFTIHTVPEAKLYKNIAYYCNDIILPIIFIFGVIGNVLNIFIFSKSRFRNSLDEVEKSATAGKLVNSVLDPTENIELQGPFLLSFSVSEHR